MDCPGPRTRWGGIRDGDFEPSGYFRIDRQNGVFWLVDPDGGRFLSKGVNTVRSDQDRIQDTERIPYTEACLRTYGNLDAWRAAAAGRLANFGFNTLGAWSDEAVAMAGRVPLATTPILDLAISFVWKNNATAEPPERQHVPDVFDPAFDEHVRRRADLLCAGRRNDQNILGWFIDNELRWGPDWRGPDELLTLFLNLGCAASGRNAAIDWLRSRHPHFGSFDQIWRTGAGEWDQLRKVGRIQAPYLRKPPYLRNAGQEDETNRADSARAMFVADCDAFEALVARRYFTLTTAAIRAADPNHLVLGSRFAYVPPAPIIEAGARSVDVISFNCYGLEARREIDAYAATGKPCLIGEFSFRAADSGLPNTNGAGTVVSTQAARAACYRHYASTALAKPNVVGLHWFEHADQPAEGRFDGENSNYGIVTIDDRVYPELTEAMAALNDSAEYLHAAAYAGTLQTAASR
jgi:agarase